MSNDLIFPILPREGKVPVKPDDRVKKVSKEAETKGLGEDERYEHDEERRVAEKHQRDSGHHQDNKAEQQAENAKENQGGSSGHKADNSQESSSDNKDSKIKHLDIYI